MTVIAESLARQVGVKRACALLAVPRSRVYRSRRTAQEAKARSRPAHALSDEERARVRATLNSQRFLDKAPRQVYAALLDENTYLCHWRTMYRVLAAHDEVRERRNVRRHALY